MKIDETLSLAKELHSHSIINGDTYYSDKLLQMIINLSTIGEVKPLVSNDLNFEDEIAKVKRKVPKWMKKTHQYNYLILKAFMDISDNNEHRVSVDELEEYVDIGQTFLANYNNLKTISAKNHGKVFDEIDRREVDKAFFYYKKACRLGSAVACFATGQMYDTGEGTKRDKKVAYEYWNRACLIGWEPACKALRE